MMVGHQTRPITSEYRRSYKESKFNSSSKIYEDNLDFRLCRRQADFNHNVDVFTWNEPSWDSESSSSGEIQRPASVPIHKLKHEKLNETYKQNQLNKTMEIKVAAPKPKSPVAVTVNGKRTPSPRQQASPVTNEKATQKEDVRDKSQQTSDVRDESQQTSDQEASSPEVSPTPSNHKMVRKSPNKPKKPGQTFTCKRFIPKAKTFPAPVGRPLKIQEDKKAPFIAYGNQDREIETAVKKTHNVRASHEVYPNAMRALQRRQAQILQQEHESKSAPYRERRKKALFNDFDAWTKRETSAWDTEYRRHYVGYDAKTYERNLSDRNNPAQRYAGDRLLATA